MKTKENAEEWKTKQMKQMKTFGDAAKQMKQRKNKEKDREEENIIDDDKRRK